jgi:metal-sulfur cluster biosynthetic enzyme
MEALRGVKDPELGFDIVTLGLIYEVKTDPAEGIDVLMTLTSPFCPFGQKIVGDIEKVLHKLHKEVRVEITFEPEWEPPEDIKLALGI